MVLVAAAPLVPGARSAVAGVVEYGVAVDPSYIAAAVAGQPQGLSGRPPVSLLVPLAVAADFRHKATLAPAELAPAS